MLRLVPKSRRRSTQHRRRGILLFSAIAIYALALSEPRHSPRIVYNPSPSAPLGYYLTRPLSDLNTGDWVLVTPPVWVADMAHDRGYLPARVPMIKAIAATSGDRVCATEKEISVNGLIIAQRLRADHLGRPLPWWSGCQTVRPDEVFLLNRAAPTSFDGRYFGLVPRSQIRAKLVHL